MNIKVCFILIVGFIMSNYGCVNDGVRSKIKQEKYLVENTDSDTLHSLKAYRDTLLNRFEDTTIQNVKHEAYKLQFYSSHGYGRSITFEKKQGYVLTSKCASRKDHFTDCVHFSISINKHEWDEFIGLIYEYDYWTEEQFRGNSMVLDGFVYLLEGNRPNAAQLQKKTYRLVGRSSPNSEDKIGVLCQQIWEYQNRLAYRYNLIKLN